MAKLLEHDTFRRSAWPPAPGSRRVAHDVLVFGALIVASLGLVGLSKLEQPIVGLVRTAIQDAAAPVLKATTAAVGPALGTARLIADFQTMAEERNRLREENDRLRGWEARARALERQTAALSELTRVVEEPRLAFATARLISGNGGPFVRVALLDAGREHGLKPGYPVLSAQGLIGRLTTVGSRSARLLLLTDHNSRVPVVIGAEAARAVVQGDNSPLPKIAYLQPGSRIKPGDEVFTSGVGGVFPNGLRLGTVVDTGEVLRVEPAARLDRLDYVSVLFFDTVGGSMSDDERAAESKVGQVRRGAAGALAPLEGGTPR